MSDKKHPHRLIWFCQMESVAEKPELLLRLKEEIGLTTIMPESHVCHTSGFAASRELAHNGPFEDWKSRLDLWPRGKDGTYPPVAGIVSGFDDAPLLKLIEACKQVGIEVWGHIGLWSYGGNVFPEYAMRDIEGNHLDERYKQWGIGLCPSRKEINEWTKDGLVEAVKRYGIDGFCVDHARYPAPANLSALFACGCDNCREEAESQGFAFESLKKGLLRWRESVRGLTRERLRAIVDAQPGFWDFLRWLGDDGVVLEWLECRALLLAGQMEEFARAVKEAGGEDKVFGSDVFPPSIALLGGHLYDAWERGADYLTGGSSFGGVVGWATTVTNLATEWVPALCRTVEGVTEEEALRLIYRLFGYDDLDLPMSVEGIQNGALPLDEIFAREVARLKAGTSGNVPLYPPVSAGGDPERVRRLCRAVADNGCDGAMVGLDVSKGENLKIVREILGG